MKKKSKIIKKTDSLGRREMRGKKYYLLLICSMVFIALSGCTSGVSEGTDEEVIIYDAKRSYNKNGMCYTNETIAHFFDAESGNDVVLCSKPNCRHTRTADGNGTVCDAYLGYGTDSLFMVGEKIVYAAAPETANLDIKDYMDREIYIADKDGKNRTLLATLENVQVIMCSAFSKGWLAIGYQATYDFDSNWSDDEVDRFEKPKSGLYLININNGDVKLIKEIEGYNASCWQCSYDGDCLYYSLYYNSEKVNFEDYSNPDDYYEDVYKVAKQEVWSYDLKSESEALMWEGTVGNIRQDCGEGYIIVDFEEESLFFKNGMLLKTYKKDDMSNHNPRFINKYVYDGMVYMTDEEKVWCMDIDTGTITYIGGGRLDEKGINRITAIIGEWVYYDANYEGKTRFYVIDRDSFMNGDIENAKEIPYE